MKDNPFVKEEEKKERETRGETRRQREGGEREIDWYAPRASFLFFSSSPLRCYAAMLVKARRQRAA